MARHDDLAAILHQDRMGFPWKPVGGHAVHDGAPLEGLLLCQFIWRLRTTHGFDTAGANDRQ